MIFFLTGSCDMKNGFEFDDNFLTNINVNKKFDYFDIYIKVTNLFNVYYKDITGIPLTGRWMVGGLKYILFEF
jgi:hypothetical protein